MDLILQFGWNMRPICLELLRAWGGGAVILSPRDQTPSQLQRASRDVRLIHNARVLVDPQFYLPHGDHERLSSHEYWPDDYNSADFWNGPDLGKLIREIFQLNDSLETSEIILPGLYAKTASGDWFNRQLEVLEEADKQNKGKSLLATVALASEALQSEDDIHEIIEAAGDWPIAGAYIVSEHPRGQYFVSDPIWIANLLDLVAGLRLKGLRVILGYCNHQMLIASLAHTTEIASGTWINVRSFPPEKFRSINDSEIKQRAVWYYCSQALSEYKLPYLDVAQRMGILNQMAPEPNFDSNFAKVLFAGPQPTTVQFGEKAAFLHYLDCLHIQVSRARKSTFEETVIYQNHLLDDSERFVQEFHAHNIRGQLRDFGEIFDVNRAAIGVFQQNRGPIMVREWSSL